MERYRYGTSFRDLKARVGVTDVAAALGYRVDRSAGVGRYVEMFLGDRHDKRDTIVISHPGDKAAQHYFHRDGSGGDVVTFVRENLGFFTVTGDGDWQKAAKVLARFANMPVPADWEIQGYGRQSAEGRKKFDPERYEVKPLDMRQVPYLFKLRGLSCSTVRDLSPFIVRIRDRENAKFDNYNIGFPYTGAAGEGVNGYEIRGYNGYKSKAAGTDSSSSAWVADLSGGAAEAVRDVYFFESAFDAMAFYQVNRETVGKGAALASVGGTFSENQVVGTMARFPNARATDCLDNDLAGRMAGLRLMAAAERIPLTTRRGEGGTYEVASGGRTLRLDMACPLRGQVEKWLGVRPKTGEFLPPEGFKDWNEVTMSQSAGKTVSKAPKSKTERETNLSARRRDGLRM